MEYLFLIVLFFLLALFIKWKFKIKVYNSTKQAFIITLAFLIIGVAADSFAVWRGYWTFHTPYVLNFTIGLLPLEEYLLFLVAPFFGITICKFFKKIIK